MLKSRISLKGCNSRDVTPERSEHDFDSPNMRFRTPSPDSWHYAIHPMSNTDSHPCPMGPRMGLQRFDGFGRNQQSVRSMDVHLCVAVPIKCLRHNDVFDTDCLTPRSSDPAFKAPGSGLPYNDDFGMDCPTPRNTHCHPSFQVPEECLRYNDGFGTNRQPPRNMDAYHSPHVQGKGLQHYDGLGTNRQPPRIDQNGPIHPTIETVQHSIQFASSANKGEPSPEAQRARLQNHGVFDTNCRTPQTDQVDIKEAQVGQSSGEVPSLGSLGHPHTCCAPCKYRSKARGCREGEKCDRCHLCVWRPSVDRLLRRRANA
mmetsp:Transcript_88143/g.247939  ORF Transcript_88143/g.247939 Transcript_88143/m.247939 type:complete len:315 (-) Transcript_88143:149-1093(-)